MTSEQIHVADAWRKAATDLGLQVQAPFELSDVDGSSVQFIAMVKGFGSPRGAVVCSFTDWQSTRGLIQQHGYFASGLNLARYAQYERSLFVQTLRDWEWKGEAPAPDWY